VRNSKNTNLLEDTSSNVDDNPLEIAVLLIGYGAKYYEKDEKKYRGTISKTKKKKKRF